ncbi:MAG: ribose 5-phosphate isomerase B [Solobacterium sp.]|nr:ribose 5-phosphate isomerase B [Solobacterium sp.]
MKKIIFGNDHSAVDLKKELIPYVEAKGYEVVNVGTDSYEAIDYPVIGEQIANMVANGEGDLGIAICGTGLGISLACNKVNGIRACVCSDAYTARYSRLHNNCNILCFGARVIGPETAKLLIDEFLDTEFEGGRHARRVGLIMDIERRNREQG